MPGLYLHIPFCEHKCVYCDFYSIAPDTGRWKENALIDRFCAALDREIELYRTAPYLNEKFDTIFFGGGTPSLLPPAEVGRLMRRLRESFDVAPEAEVTLETNPGTVDAAKLLAFREAGVNRLSIGVQSFHEDDLRFLTRIHSADQARACVRDARSAGFANVSLDLIFSLPDQTPERWEWNLEQALALEPDHLSCYSLIVEPNTPLYRMVASHEVAVPGSEADAALYEQTMETLLRNGFEQYEVSNFARGGARSRHNLGYWDHSNYLAFGPSAHGFWVDRRWWNIAQLQTYCERLERSQLPVAGEERLRPLQLAEEAVFLGLRSDGIDLARFAARFGRDLQERNAPLIERLISDGLAVEEKGRLRLTARGYLLCDEICQSFR